MSTINQTVSSSISFSGSEPKSITRLMEQLEESRLVLFPFLLLPIVCLSGIAVGFGAHGDMLKLLLVCIPNVFSLAFTLGLVSTRWVMSAFLITILMDVLVLVA